MVISTMQVSSCSYFMPNGREWMTFPGPSVFANVFFVLCSPGLRATFVQCSPSRVVCASAPIPFGCLGSNGSPEFWIGGIAVTEISGLLRILALANTFRAEQSQSFFGLLDPPWTSFAMGRFRRHPALRGMEMTGRASIDPTRPVRCAARGRNFTGECAAELVPALRREGKGFRVATRMAVARQYPVCNSPELAPALRRDWISVVTNSVCRPPSAKPHRRLHRAVGGASHARRCFVIAASDCRPSMQSKTDASPPTPEPTQSRTCNRDLLSRIRSLALPWLRPELAPASRQPMITHGPLRPLRIGANTSRRRDSQMACGSATLTG